MPAVISSEVFQKRLVVLCVKGSDAGLPRKQADRKILLMAAAMALDPDTSYSESDLNESLSAWLDTVGRRIATDHVTMRRALVDDHFLLRDPAGNAYRVAPDIGRDFDSDVLTLDPSAIVAAARAEREARRREHSQGSG